MVKDPSGVFYRPLCPSDFFALKLLHQRLFPLDYDDDFFGRAVHGLDNIVAWAAAAPLPSLTHVAVGSSELAPQLLVPPPPQEQQPTLGCDGAAPPELLAGFITARSFQAMYADPRDRQLLGLARPELDQQCLLYVLTLGVAEPYQRQGIARRLLNFVLNYAAETACAAVYLHVAAFNQQARAFYERAGFRELALLPNFYTIRTGRQPEPSRERYDACLLACLVCPPQPTPWGAVNLAVAPLTAVVHGINSAVGNCMPWGHFPRKQGLVAAAGGGARRIDVVVEEVEDGSGSMHGHSLSKGAAAAVGGAEKQQQQPTQPAQPAPEWLRSLFTRR